MTSCPARRAEVIPKGWRLPVMKPNLYSFNERFAISVCFCLQPSSFRVGGRQWLDCSQMFFFLGFSWEKTHWIQCNRKDISIHSCYHKQATSIPCAISFGLWATQPFDLNVSPQPRLHDDSVSVWWKMNLYIQRIFGEINQYDYGSKPCTPGEHHICTPVSTQIWYDPFDWIVIAMYSTAMPAARKCRKQLVLTTIILIFKKDGIVNSGFCWFTKR